MADKTKNTSSEKKIPKSLIEELQVRMLSSDGKKERSLSPAKEEEKVIEEAAKKITKKDIEEEKKSIASKEETLIPLEEYIKCAVHLGTKVITPTMRKYVYKRRADGLAVINTILIDG